MATLLAGSAAAGALGAGLIPGVGVASSAAAGVAGAAAGGTALSTALSILQGVATVTSIFGTLGAAENEAIALEGSARMTELDAGQNQLASTQRQSVMKRELMRVLGENDVAIAAAGIDLTGGVAESSRAQIKGDASREISIEREDDELRRALLKARSSGLRTRAAGAREGGLLRAFGQGASLATDLFERG